MGRTLDATVDYASVMLDALTVDVLTVERRAVALHALIESAVEIAQPAARAKGVGFKFRHDSRPRLIEVDVRRLQHAFANLIENAVTYTEPGRHVLLWSYFGAEFVEIGVRNAGGGVRPEYLASNPDAPDDETDLAATNPMGYAMALAKQLVELQDGHLEVRGAAHGAVASLVVRLPDSVVRQPAAASTSLATPRASLQTRLDGLHILLVEDDPDALEFLALILRAAGAQVSAYGLAEPAFSYFVSAPSESRPDIIVSDVAMPIEDGYSFLTRMRAWEQRNSSLPVPAIAVTAFSREEDCRRALASGFDRHVAKPIDAERLVDAIALWS